MAQRNYSLLETSLIPPRIHQARNLLTPGAEWVKGLLAVPFVLYSQPTGAFDPEAHNVNQATEEAHRRYAEIMRDVEVMLDDHSKSAHLLPNPIPPPSTGEATAKELRTLTHSPLSLSLPPFSSCSCTPDGRQ